MRRTTFFKWLQISCFLLVSLVGTERAVAQCPVVTQPVQTFCDVESPAVSSLTATDMGGGIVWYATATSTTPLSPTAGLVSGEDYFAGDASGTCTERQSVVVTIYSAPTGLNFQGPCVETPEEATIADLVAVGYNIQWYNTPTGGTPIPYSTILVDNTIYYASQTNPNTGCESSRMSVFVNVGLVPVPQGNALQQFCNLPESTPTVANLQPNGPGYRWYATISSAVPLPMNTPLIDGETYYATSVDPPCESENRLEVTVELITPNNAGGDGLLSFCENAIAPGQTVDLFSGLGGAPDITGFWVGPAAIANGHLGTVDISTLTAAGSPYTFVYRVESSECPAATATVTIEILPPPTANIKATPILCEATEGVVTITGTPGATVTYTANGDTFSVVLDASGIGQIIGLIDFTTVYTLVSVTSATTPACTTLLSESATIEVLPLPVATVFSTDFICFGDTATVVFSGTPGATVSFSVNGGPVQSLVLDVSGQAFYESAFTSNATIALLSVSSNDTLLCTRPLTQVLTITVEPLPVVSILGAAEICPGQIVDVTFTGAPGTLVRYTVNSGEIQEILIGPTGVATLSAQYTQTTIIDLLDAVSPAPHLCPAPVNGSVTITVAELPVAELSSDVEICQGESATVTVTGTPGATVWYSINGAAPVSIVLDASGQAQISGTYTETTVIALTSVWSAGLPSCEQIPDATVTIFVTPLPVISLNEDVQICPGQSAIVTFTGTPGATVNYTVNGAAASIVLDASGVATIEQTYTETTVYVLVSAQTSGTPSCNAPQSGQMTVEVLPLPFVNISGEAGICAGDEAVITFTGTPGAVVSYTVNNGAVQTIVLDASGMAQLTQIFIEDALFTLISVSLTEPAGCDFPVAGQVQITVSDLPVVAISGDITICQGQQATVVFTGTPAAIATYSVNGGPAQTIVLDDFGTAELTQTYSETTVITLIDATVPGISSCTQLQTGIVTITVLPLPTASLSENQQVCIGAEATVVFTGTPGALISYTVNGLAQTILLDAAGSASLTANYAETTTYVLISAETETPECQQNLSQTMTVSVVPFPQAQIVSTQAVCAGQPALIPIQGTPGAAISYTVNNGTLQTIMLDGSGNAVISGDFADGDVVALVQASTGAPLNCTVSLDDSVIIEIISPSVVSISESDEICAGGTATVTFTGDPDAIVNFTVNGAPQTIVLDNTGMASIAQVFNATTVFALVSVINAGTPSCTQPLSESITVTVVPLPEVTVPETVLFCAGTSATVSLNGTPGAVLTYLINGNPTPQTVVFDATGTATLTGFSASTSVTLVSVALPLKPFCQRLLGQTFAVTPIALPTVSISLIGESSVCAGQSAVVQFSGTPNSTVTYTANGEPQTIVLNASGLAFLTSNLLAETTYAIVSVAMNQTPFCTQLQTGSVTVDVIPTPTAGNDVAEVIFCQNSAPADLFLLLGPNAETGGTWTPALASGTGVFNPALDAAGIYFYNVAGTGDCPGDTASVTVVIEQIAQAGNDAATEVCSNQGPVDMFALLGPLAQTGGVWTPQLASGTGVFDPIVDAAGVYTYTVALSAFCPPDSAQVNVTVVPGPEAGTDGTLAICENSGPQDLFNALNGTPQIGGTWSPTLVSGSGIFDPAADAPGIYTYQFAGSNPCDNDSATVTVTVEPAPYAGENALAVLCSNDAPIDLLALLSGGPQPGGIWTPALASGTGIFNPEVDAAGLYTYTVGGGLCPQDTATLIVQIIQSPDAGDDGFLQTCVSSGVIDLTAGLDGTQGVGVWSDDDGTGALVGNLFNTALVAAGTYHFTYTVTGGTSPCNTDTATVTVEVSAQVEAGTFTGTQSVCADAGTFNLFDLLTGYDEGGQWTDSNGTVVPAVVSLTGLPTGPALFFYSVTNGCGTDAVQATFVIDPIPQLTSVNISVPGLVCAFAALPVSLGAMPDGNYTLTYHLSGANVHSDQTGIATITGGLGTLVIPGNLLANAGATTLNIVNILNAETICGNTVEHAAVNFYVNPVPDLAEAEISIATVCFGENVTVSIAEADLLSDGTYVFDYTISGFGDITFSSGPVSIVAGEGNFSVSSNVFSAPGTYALTIVGMFNQAGGCGNTTMQYTVDFEIIPTPDLSLIFIAVNNACVDFGTTVTIEGLSDGVYTLGYQLSGQSTAFGTVQLVVEEGTGSFELPATDIPNLGVVNFAITQLEFAAGECGFIGTAPTVSFEVKPLQTPELAFRGNLFCETRNPTIADLSANIIGNLEVIWYDAPVGGTAYAPAQLLVHGQTYYATFAPGQGCESTIRLAVEVDLSYCFELLIPDGFSPNNDGINDDFEIVNLIELYPDFKLEIYNRYGNLLYKGDRNTPNWDGTVTEGGLKVGSATVPTGVYFFILEFNDGHSKPLQGRVYLNR